jgi:hypothetical protein
MIKNYNVFQMNKGFVDVLLSTFTCFYLGHCVKLEKHEPIFPIHNYANNAFHFVDYSFFALHLCQEK